MTTQGAVKIRLTRNQAIGKIAAINNCPYKKRILKLTQRDWDFVVTLWTEMTRTPILKELNERQSEKLNEVYEKLFPPQPKG